MTSRNEFFLLMILALGVFPFFAAVAQPFDTQRDMGSCAAAPHFGKNCVIIPFKLQLESVVNVRQELNKANTFFTAMAVQNKLGKITQQYESYKTTESWYNNARGYELEARFTYELKSPVEAEDFVSILKKQHYEAGILSDMMKNAGCNMPY